VDYDNQEITVGSTNTITIHLIARSNSLNDVVVVGYGVRKKASLTGAVTSISSKDIQNQVTNNVLNAVSGQMSGVQVISTTGRPGASPILRIRGTGSIGASNVPLYVVDGMPLASEADLNLINPNDIETIDVLKEASAAAIYGSRGSNGVVLITTKKGKSGQSKIDFTIYHGNQDVPKRIKMNDRNQEAQWWKEGTAQIYALNGGDPSVPNGSRLVNGSKVKVNYLPGFDNPDTMANTDWQSVVLRNNAAVSNYQVSAQGGTEKVHYFVSGNYFTQDGVVKTTDYKRYVGRANLDANVNKYFRVGINISPSYSIEDRRNTDAHINSPDFDASFILGSLVQSTTIRPKDPVTGRYEGVSGGYNVPYTSVGYAGAANPLQIIESPLYKWAEERLRFNGISYAELEPVRGLVIRTEFGLNTTTGYTNKYRPSTVSAVAGGTIVNYDNSPATFNLQNISASHAESRDINYVWNNTITWNRTFSEDHSISLLGGYAYQKAIGESSSIAGVSGTFQNDAVQYVSAATSTTSSATKSEWNLLSYFGRANYTYRNKIIVDGSVRRDGSSRFGLNNKFAVFPAGGLAWRMTQEPFMRSLTFLDELKLRVGYGRTGNFNIGNYPSIATLAVDNYNFNNVLAAGYAPGSAGNANLTWETTTTKDGGFDAILWKSRLSVTFDYYVRTTNGLLYSLGIPAVSGFTSVLSNIGNIQNKGVELTLNSVNVRSKDFRWTTNLNISRNRNKVLSLAVFSPSVKSITSGFTEGNFSEQRYGVGMPMAYFYGYKLGGIFKDQKDVDDHPENRLSNASGVLQGGPGDSKIVDVNHDGKVTVDDKTKIGDPNPDFTYGISNHFTYKQFDLDIQLQGVKGGDIEFLTARFIGSDNLDWAQLAEAVTNRWKSPQEPGNGIYPRVGGPGAAAQTALNETQSDRWLRDASYLRIRNVTLGYNLPTQVVRRVKLGYVRFYATAENLWTFTRYVGYNPDVDIMGESAGMPGVDYATYPLARTFTLGVNLGL
jgi:TonB-linked SusC/RagA family outer membrane protein